MAKPQRRPAAKAPPPKGKRREPEAEEEFPDSDSDDDAFKNKKDKVNLNMSDDEGDDDSLDVEGVYDLDEDEDGSDDGEDEEDDDDIIADALRQGGEVAELAKVAKSLGQRLKLRRGEEEEEDEEEARAAKRGEGVDGERLWGASRKAYYDADAEAASDEDAGAEEEEALRLQRERASKLSAADFGLDEDDSEEGEEDEDEDDDEEEEAGPTMAALADGRPDKKKGGAKGGAPRAGEVQVEAVDRDLAALGDDARMAALMADAPELLSLLNDLQDSLGEVRHRVSPLLTELRDGGLATAEGLSYLEAKHLLLLSYCSHIVFYLLLKAEGRPVRDHPVIQRLVEIRAYLEKIRPIDKHLSYQIDKLLKASTLAAAGALAAENGDDGAAGPGPGSGADADALRYGPRPDALVPKTKAGAPGAAGAAAMEGAEDAAGVYRPPKLVAASMELDAARAKGGAAAAADGAAGDLSVQERRRLKELKAKAQRSDTIRALQAELTGAPEEERAAVAGLDSAAALRTRARLEARAAVEEDMFSRVPLSKDEAKRLRQQRRAGMSGAAMLEDFGDEVADLVDLTRGGAGAGSAGGLSERGAALSDLFARQRVSQRFGADHASLGKRPTGGDEDLPRREPLHERRAKFDAAAARHKARAGDDDGDGAEEYDLGGGAREGKKRRGPAGEEDEMYAAAKASAASRKKARAETHRAPALQPPAPDPTADGARGITDEIQRNRGLTPHRRRDQKNPRKKNRMKFEKAMVRVKGAVQPVRKPEAVAYGGEATGIKSKVAKSRRL
ncbi:hypothetical protein HYH03_002500 [Edaphochlamys debaryana]|uniref:Sas10 C-terminal domain-containing protein n=1 Tax=Edaphochlamys debaryana TaxID=47281 RepID=A0A836C472_9CHLO|nr:hypothetical protein HYH03_002500 [Edaphochlamys debaryana]|eukprot:KAG2499555.1 hypothetical protein HYH03_002500 [Edaphochlamys debaryana]